MITDWIGIIIIIQNSLIILFLAVLVYKRLKQSKMKGFHDYKTATPCGGSYSTDEYLDKFEKEDFTLSELVDPLAPTYDTIREIIESTTYGGTTEDKLPEGYGEFGWDLTNPIPTVNRRGARQYLSLLRTLEDQPVRYLLKGSFRAENVGYPVDLYVLFVNDEEIGRIYMSSFQETNSHKAPDGFCLDIKS